MLILNETDVILAITFEELLKAVEEALLLQETGDYYMPDRSHLHYNGNVQLLMPAFAGNYFSTKLVSVFPGNAELGKPTINGTVILNDGLSGEPLAVMNGSKLTALRTGAVGALGVAYTSRKEASTLGLIGAGAQGYHQVLFACVVRNIKKVGIVDPHHPNLPGMLEEFRKYLPGIEFTIYEDVPSLLRHSEIVITATTSTTPVLPNDPELLRGKHYVGIGSYTPEVQEYPESLFSLIEEVYVDTPLASVESGDIAIPLKKGLLQEDQVHTLGKLMNGSLKEGSAQTTFFKSVGMALFDLMVAKAIHRNAVKKGIGQHVNF